jgi:hypothetical protein
MKYFIHTFIIALFLIGGEALAQETPALVFVNVAGDPANGPANPGRVYINSARGAARDGNGNSNAAFGNIGDWAIDMVVSELSPEDAANSFGGFTDDQHAKLDYGGFPKHYFADNSIYDALIVAGADPDGNTVNRNLYVGSNAKTQYNNGLGALGWGSFGANAYNRASGVGSVAMGFNNIAGRSDAESNGITGDDIGQAVFGYASRATGNISFAAGFRNTASGQKTVAMGNFNNASGDSSVAIGKDNYAQGASTVAIGFQSHAAGDGSVALGQQNVSWGTTNFTAGYQNIAGDVTAARGSGGSAVAMGKYNMATADTSMALNRGTAAINQAATAMGFRTVADNAGMLAIGVNNVTGLGDTASGNYFYTDGAYNGLDPGVAFVIGNGDINTQAYARGNNPSNAFIVYYDGDATLSGDLTVNSDARLKSNIMSLGSTLAKLMKIDGKTYTLKSNKKENKIGLLAQEIEEVFPELVKEGEDKDGTLSVNYQGLIPVLINAIKEQQEELNGIRKSVNEDR